MKRILFAIIAAVSMITASAQKIEFASMSHDFGSIKEANGPVSCTFKFTNTGDAPLVIKSAKASCGCTKPEFPRKPIAPGDSQTIKVTYNPQGRPGEFTKDITLKTNDSKSRRVVLRIKGTVIPNK